MKDFDRRIRQGGDDAIAAVGELTELVKERRGYEEVMNAKGDITDIVTVLRGVGFAAVSPQAGDSASMLHYCVTHAADEIERLREGQRWIPVEESLPEDGQSVIVFWSQYREVGEAVFGKKAGWFSTDRGGCYDVSHWMRLPVPPDVK
jgi:hypothetical protein